MGSFTDTIECPQCSGEAWIEMYYKTGEEVIGCPDCGYSKQFVIVNKETKSSVGEFEWVPDFKLEEITGTGAYKLREKDSKFYEHGSFNENLNEALFIQMVEEQKHLLAFAEYRIYKDGVLQPLVTLIQDDSLLGPFTTPEELEKDFKNTTNT